MIDTKTIIAVTGLVIFILIRLFWKNPDVQEMAKFFIPFILGILSCIITYKFKKSGSRIL